MTSPTRRLRKPRQAERAEDDRTSHRAAPGERTYRADRFVRHVDVISWAVDFANTDLGSLDPEEFRKRCDDLLQLDPYSRNFLWEQLERDVIELHSELRQILADLASGDRAHRTANELPSLANTARELAVSFQWERDDNEVSEQLYPHDVRSGVLIRLRDALMTSRRHFRLRKCAACHRFFVPRRRQLSCSATCGIQLREARRDPEKRNESRRQAYATKKRQKAARNRRRN